MKLRKMTLRALVIVAAAMGGLWWYSQQLKGIVRDQAVSTEAEQIPSDGLDEHGEPGPVAGTSLLPMGQLITEIEAALGDDVSVLGEDSLTDTEDTQASQQVFNALGEVVEDNQLHSSQSLSVDDFCARLPTMKLALESAMVDRIKSMDLFLDGFGERRENERNSHDAKQSEVRSESDQKRSEWYVQLAALATTKDEQNAVKQYEQRVDLALETYREAIDQAVAEYRQGRDVMVRKQALAIQLARDHFRQAVSGALEKSEIGCSQGTVATAQHEKILETSLVTTREQLMRDSASIIPAENHKKILVDPTEKATTMARAILKQELILARASLQAVLK